jgi:hypothetical protein
LNILDLQDKYDFTLEIPDEDNLDFKPYAQIKLSISHMISSVNLNGIDLPTKMLINGGVKK